MTKEIPRVRIACLKKFLRKECIFCCEFCVIIPHSLHLYMLECFSQTEQKAAQRPYRFDLVNSKHVQPSMK